MGKNIWLWFWGPCNIHLNKEIIILAKQATWLTEKKCESLKFNIVSRKVSFLCEDYTVVIFGNILLARFQIGRINSEELKDLVFQWCADNWALDNWAPDISALNFTS